MNPLILLISFSPWILFGIIAGHSLLSLEIALGVSLLTSFIVGFKDLKKKMIVSWATITFFIIACLLVIVFQVYAIIPFLGIGSNIVLTLIAFGSLVAGLPFTMQYARQEVPRDRWDNPEFIRINQVLTAGWGVLFLFGLFNSLMDMIQPGFLGIIGDASMYITIIIGIIFTVTYPPYAKKRYAERKANQ